MQSCYVIITTTADGKESTITREGRMELAENVAKLSYREENALVCMELSGDCARIERAGDYTLKLRLQNGKAGEGEIGIGGSSGKIGTFTDYVLWSASNGELQAVLHYDLLIAGQRQKMRLKLTARKGERL